MAAKKSKRNDPKRKPRPSKTSKSEPPWKKAEAEDDDDDDEEEEDEDDDDEEEDLDDDERDDDDEEEEDEDDDDEDDEEDVAPPPRRRAAGRASRPKEPVVAKRKERTYRADDEPSVEDNLPSWLPWAVLIALVTVGILGAAGVFGHKKADGPTAADVPTPTPSSQAEGPTGSISAQHLLVQYKGAARAAPSVTRTKEEAKQRAEEAYAKAKKGEDFDKLVEEYSDEPGAKQRKGKLGSFTRDRMVAPFSNAAFALEVGEISKVVETPFGFHVIKRTE
ncbi:MAG: peptidyl-prolyl cis-trans isomerase [Polyangiaceae bacterium]|nr:peptidyl-prolyl cis-trans isomerase [Polyangiaceae bacterium]